MKHTEIAINKLKSMSLADMVKTRIELSKHSFLASEIEDEIFEKYHNTEELRKAIESGNVEGYINKPLTDEERAKHTEMQIEISVTKKNRAVKDFKDIIDFEVDMSYTDYLICLSEFWNNLLKEIIKLSKDNNNQIKQLLFSEIDSHGVRETARVLGVDAGYISRIRSKKRFVGTENIIKMLDKLI